MNETSSPADRLNRPYPLNLNARMLTAVGPPHEKRVVAVDARCLATLQWDADDWHPMMYVVKGVEPGGYSAADDAVHGALDGAAAEFVSMIYARAREAEDVDDFATRLTALRNAVVDEAAVDRWREARAQSDDGVLNWMIRAPKEGRDAELTIDRCVSGHASKPLGHYWFWTHAVPVG